MSLSIYRRKLLNAVLYFLNHTNRVNTTKLLKLLYQLDFMHFRQVGYPSIGLTYYAWEQGPVPVRFWKEIEKGRIPKDFEGLFAINIKAEDAKPDYNEYQFIAHASEDMTVFTPRETKIMETLADKYKNSTAKEISEETHLPNQPWDTTIKTRGKNKQIEYLFSLDRESSVNWDTAKNNLVEFYTAIRNFRLNPTKAARIH